MENLLVVVDMVNGFVNEWNLADKKINRIVPNIVKLINNFINNNEKILAFKDTHSIDDEEFKLFLPHCIKGTNECELIPELKVYENKMKIIEKPTTNGFNTEEFQDYINRNKFNSIIVAGCCTDICVYNFVVSLKDYLDKNKRKDKIIVVEDAVDTFNAKEHIADEINKKYLKMIKKLGVETLDLSKINCLGEEFYG